MLLLVFVLVIVGGDKEKVPYQGTQQCRYHERENIAENGIEGDRHQEDKCNGTVAY